MVSAEVTMAVARMKENLPARAQYESRCFFCNSQLCSFGVMQCSLNLFHVVGFTINQFFLPDLIMTVLK